GVIVWHSTKTLPAIVQLSEQLQCEVHWLSVFEEITIRAYGWLSKGRWSDLILDPKRYWRENLLEGNDLIGEGNRHFPTLDAFLQSIEPKYHPADDVWDFESWQDESRRLEKLASPDLR